jgi:uncharacterized membrane protein YeaQ/YmgE (transglycosylase-associated protein family)
MYIIGFVVWTTIGILAGLAVDLLYRGPTTTRALTLIFGFFGAFIGGMLAMSGYLFHDPAPLRPGGLLGAAAGAIGFTFLYHFIAKKVV